MSRRLPNRFTGTKGVQHHKIRVMYQIDTTHQKKLKCKKILSHARPFTRYAHFCKFHMIPISEEELRKNHVIGQIDSTQRDESIITKIIKLLKS